MKYSLQLGAFAALLATEVAAFPAAVFEESAKRAASSMTEESTSALAAWKASRQVVGFNAAQQYVSNQGQYAFVAPSNVNTLTGDQRGPCPGLNAMANHGYIPHNGVATIAQLINGTETVFGMGADLGAFLSIYGALFDGNLAAWSIGGPSSQLASLPVLLSTPQGISGSHNKYESDVSPTRPDLYEYGNDYKVIISQFQDLFSRQPDASTANYNLDVLTKFRADRFNQSIANNPYFFNGPFSGVAVQPAAYTFIYRFMANKSAEYPEGILNQDVLKSFFAITGDSGSFTWTEGHEAIPNNWYKRAIGDEYTIPYFLADLNTAALEYPQFLSIGGNTGTVNTFTGVDISNLTGGVYNARSLTNSNNLACFLYQVVQGTTPDILEGALTSDSSILGQISSLLSSVLSGISMGLTCPQLNNISTSQFSQFPGYTKQPYY